MNYWIKGEGEIEDDWYADDRPDLDHAPYWPQYADRKISGMIGAEYKPLSWVTAALFYEPIWGSSGFENACNFYTKISIPGKHEYRAE